MRHPFDPRINASFEQAVWHADPNLEALVVALVEKCQPDTWVESGSHYGWSSHYMASRWPNLHIDTVEIDDGYYAIAKDNLAEFPNVVVAHMSSADYFRNNRERYSRQLPFFWCDAHWWKDVPLQAECAVISTLPRYICLIDDFECKNPDFAGDGGEVTFGYRMCNHDYVAEWMGKRVWRPNYEAAPGQKGYGLFLKGVEFDMPAFMKEDVIE